MSEEDLDKGDLDDTSNLIPDSESLEAKVYAGKNCESDSPSEKSQHNNPADLSPDVFLGTFQQIPEFQAEDKLDTVYGLGLKLRIFEKYDTPDILNESISLFIRYDDDGKPLEYNVLERKIDDEANETNEVYSLDISGVDNDADEIDIIGDEFFRQYINDVLKDWFNDIGISDAPGLELIYNTSERIRSITANRVEEETPVNSSFYLSIPPLESSPYSDELEIECIVNGVFDLYMTYGSDEIELIRCDLSAYINNHYSNLAGIGDGDCVDVIDLGVVYRRTNDGEYDFDRCYACRVVEENYEQFMYVTQLEQDSSCNRLIIPMADEMIKEIIGYLQLTTPCFDDLPDKIAGFNKGEFD